MILIYCAAGTLKFDMSLFKLDRLLCSAQHRVLSMNPLKPTSAWAKVRARFMSCHGFGGETVHQRESQHIMEYAEVSLLKEDFLWKCRARRTFIISACPTGQVEICP